MDSGNNATYTANTLTDTRKAWRVNQFAGGVVVIIRGTGIGQKKWIHTNNSTTLWVTDWAIRPDAGSYYVVARDETLLSNYIVYDPSWEQIPAPRVKGEGTGTDE